MQGTRGNAGDDQPDKIDLCTGADDAVEPAGRPVIGPSPVSKPLTEFYFCIICGQNGSFVPPFWVECGCGLRATQDFIFGKSTE
jgi:hypothetical protein